MRRVGGGGGEGSFSEIESESELNDTVQLLGEGGGVDLR